jgi:hypothetical protein
MATTYVENVYVSSRTLLDAKQGPFNSVAEAQAAVPLSARSIGLFHFIITGAGAKLYWYKNGVTNDDLTLFVGNSSVEVYDTFLDFPLLQDASQDVIYIAKDTATSYYFNSTVPEYVPFEGESSVEIYPSRPLFPNTGAENIIYIADDTNISYIWNGRDYEILTGVGKSIISIERTSGNGSPGTTDVYTIKYTDLTTYNFSVYNGANGQTGLQGPEGSQGPAGPQGTLGPTGPTGPQGPIGPAGPSGGTSFSSIGRFGSQTTATVITPNTEGIIPWPTIDSSNTIGSLGITYNTTPRSFTNTSTSTMTVVVSGFVSTNGANDFATSLQIYGVKNNQSTNLSNRYSTNSILLSDSYDQPIMFSFVITLAQNDFFDIRCYLDTFQTGNVSINGDNSFVNEPNSRITISRIDGVEGPSGPQGPSGATGPQGPTGQNGLDGAQGPIGPQGIPGATGAQGAPGIQGPIGVQGLRGEIGFPGFKYDARRILTNQYVVGEIIEYNGNYFICLANNDAILPTGAAIGLYWNPYSFVGPQGDDGVGIVSIEWTSSTGGGTPGIAGATDTYTITYTEGSPPTSTFDVYNGADGNNGVLYYTAQNTNTYTVSNITTYNVGDVYTIKFINANTGTSTLNGKSLKNTKTQNNLLSGDIRINETHLLVYDGTEFQVLTIGPNSSTISGGSGSGGIVDMGDRLDGLELVDMGSRI